MTAMPECRYDKCTHPECDCQSIERARAYAKERGHTDVDALIVCKDGTKLPVWHFYQYAVDRGGSDAG
jgi:hypothetical protein